MLFGPGVKEVESENKKRGNNMDKEILAILGPLWCLVM
jgi:hypothetical protein